LLKALADTDVEIRRSAANAFAVSFGFGSKADILALKKRASTESDEETRNNLETAIERLERRK
jgi:HEAT repeat protein